jgi:hypothetical protein
MGSGLASSRAAAASIGAKSVKSTVELASVTGAAALYSGAAAGGGKVGERKGRWKIGWQS